MSCKGLHFLLIGIMAFVVGQAFSLPTIDSAAWKGCSTCFAGEAHKKKIVLIAGRGSHQYGAHEFKAGCMLLARLLNENAPGVKAFTSEGWPKDAKVLQDADAIVVFCDGGGGHVLNGHYDELDKLIAKGAGFACIHYALDVPKGKKGDHLLDWMGGYYEQHWSVNPFWKADFKELPRHPITRGVKPFVIEDEWYYNMRFRKEMKGVTPILTAIPPISTRRRKDGPHSNNPHVRARVGMPEHVAWAYERPNGGRGFGFTGIHFHWNLAHDDYRKVLLNALVWISGAKVPPAGVQSKTPTVEELQANIGTPKPKNWNPERIKRMIEKFNRPGK